MHTYNTFIHMYIQYTGTYVEQAVSPICESLKTSKTWKITKTATKWQWPQRATASLMV